MLPVTNLRRIDLTTREGYDKQSWLEEAERHVRSAKLLRSIRRRRRSRFKTVPESRRLQYVRTMDAAVHSSTLLIAYAFELLLKAGLTALYVGCTRQLFARDIRARFSHKLVRIAREIEFPLTASSEEQLRELQEVILSEGRYPFLSDDSKQDIASRNRRAVRFWDDKHFRSLLALLDAVREHVASLDQDSKNPASFSGSQIDTDGYFAFRCGGNLSPRIVVKYSSEQRKLRRNNRRALRRLILREPSEVLVRHWWASAKFRCVKY